MSEVKLLSSLEIAQSNSSGKWAHQLDYCSLEDKFLQVTAERDAALEDLRLAKQLQKTTDAIVMMVEGQRDHWIEKCHALQQRLTAADELADEMEGLLREYPGQTISIYEKAWTAKVRAALKPAGGGGDEAMSFAQIAQFNDDHDRPPERDD